MLSFTYFRIQKRIRLKNEIDKRLNGLQTNKYTNFIQISSLLKAVVKQELNVM